jgi:hypothetical protein
MAEFDDLHSEVHELIDTGDRVFGSFTVHGRGKHSGAETSWDVVSVWTVRDGRVVRWQGFTDRDPALEAAGLRSRRWSKENVQIVREGYAADNAAMDAPNPREAVRAVWERIADPEIEWEQAFWPPRLGRRPITESTE